MDDKAVQTFVDTSETVNVAISAITMLPSLVAGVELRKVHLSRAQERLRTREDNVWRLYNRRPNSKIERRPGFHTSDMLRLWPPRTPRERNVVERWERAKEMLSIVQECLQAVESDLKESLKTLGDKVAAAFSELLDLYVEEDADDLKAALLMVAEENLPESLKVEDEPLQSEDGQMRDVADALEKPTPDDIGRRRLALQDLVEQCDAAKTQRTAARTALNNFFKQGRRVDPIPGESTDDRNFRALKTMRDLTQKAQDAESEYSKIAERAAKEDARSSESMSGHFPMYHAYPNHRQEEAEAEGRQTLANADFDAIADWKELVRQQATAADPEKLPIQWHQREHSRSSMASTIRLNEEINHKNYSHRGKRMIAAWTEKGLRSYDDLIDSWPDEIIERPQRASPDHQRYVSVAVQTDATPPGTPASSDRKSDSYFTPPESTSSTDTSTASSPYGSMRSGASAGNVWSDIQRASDVGSADMPGRDSCCYELL
ncbi:uncharacterized protein AB675_11474 [Cyphellophora attinorum]|uniref:Uncharacterized protein n=1 Tax=Cyphellophora attinorum TaxID=1664694 RepID=A0A0N1P128_9EURO|nr:uncharacterized protein AB675_11474 [Phialophora attinorum]KPI40025.1 hypothetical protein AB675_11474 [Phialophora attinorum]